MIALKRTTLIIATVALCLLVSKAILADDEKAVEVIDLVDHEDIVDVAPLANGDVVYLTKSKGVIWLNDKGEPQKFDMNTKVRLTFERVFPVIDQPDAFYAIALLGAEQKDGLGVYYFTKKKMHLVAFARERIVEPNYHQAPGGEIFVSSRTGVVYRCDGKLLHRHALAWPANVDLSLRKMYRRIEFASHKNGPTCLYSIADREFHDLALLDIIVADKNGWRTLPLELKATGPACMSNGDTFRMLLYDRWVIVDLKTGKKSEVTFKTPGAPEDRLRAMKVVALPDGTFVSIWRRPFRSFKKYDVDNYSDGTFHRIGVWKDDHWELAPVGIDRELYRKQSHHIDSQGGLWMLSGEGGLVHRSSTGKWREFADRHRLPIQSVHNLAVAKDDLYITYGIGKVTRVHRQRLLVASKSPKTAWRVYRTRSELREPGPRQTPVLKSVTGRLVSLTPRGVLEIPPPANAAFADLESFRIWSDERGSVWMLSENGEHVARYHNEKWRVFAPAKTESGVLLAPLEVACQQMVAENYGWRAKLPLAALGPDSQIAVTDGKRVSYFNGKQWYIHRGGREFEASDIAEVSFTQTGLRVELQSADFHEMNRDQWSDIKTNASVRPWKNITEMVEQAEEQASLSLQNPFPLNAVLDRCPTRAVYAIQVGEESVLAFNSNEIACYENHWSTADRSDCPFMNEALGETTEVGIAYGRIFVETKVADTLFQVAVYDPPGVEIEAGDADLGELKSIDDKLPVRWKSKQPAPDARFRYNIDDGPWSQWLPIEGGFKPWAVPTPGRHQVRIELHDSIHIFKPALLQYETTVSYNAGKIVRDLVQKLGSDAFIQREQAATKLAKFGPLMRPLLLELLKNEDDLEIKTQLRKVLVSLD